MGSWNEFLRLLQTSGHHGLRKNQRGFGRKQNLRVESLENRVLLAADLASLSPADDSADVAAGSNLVLTFTEEVTQGPGTGNILIRNADDGSLIEAVNVNSDQVTIDGANVTVDPSQALPGNANIVVHVDAGSLRDTGTDVTTQTIFSEDFESLPLKNSLLNVSFDDYLVVFSGVLDVKVAGDYTFGGNSDDGQALAIDVAQDGLALDNLFDDLIYEDNSNHGSADRLHTCDVLFEEGVNEIASCVGEGLEPAITLEVGQYEFAWLYYDGGGGGNGEFFYAPGYHEAFDSSVFAVVGDDSQGIGVTEAGITATTYKEFAPNEIGDLDDAYSVLLDETTIIGQETVEFADVNEGSGGRFGHDLEIPGFVQFVTENDPSFEDWTDEAPFGWTRDNSDLIEGGAAEYNGFVFLDKEFWIAEQGGQSRTDFELGEGTVLVADPDAHDDFIDNGGFDAAACLAVLEFGPECGLFTASTSTPPIYLNGVVENTATLNFASSWWDEDTQSAETRVEYFDAEGNSLGTNVLLRWESIPESDNYKPQQDSDTGINARNEQVEVALENPADAASMIITFDMPYATNDWWWSVDNVVVTADVPGALFAGIADDSWTFSTGEGGVECPLAEFGDIDCDGEVQFSDFTILAENFGTQVEPGTNGDIDGDGEVQFSDFAILAENFGRTGAPAAPAAGSSVDVVFAASDDGEGDSVFDSLGL